MLKLYLKEEFANKGKEIISYSFLSLHPLFIYFKFYFKIYEAYIGKGNENISQRWKGKCKNCNMEWVCVCVCADTCMCTHTRALSWSSFETLASSPSWQVHTPNDFPCLALTLWATGHPGARYQTVRDHTYAQILATYWNQPILNLLALPFPFQPSGTTIKVLVHCLPLSLCLLAKSQSSLEWPYRELSFLSKKLWT